MSLILYNVLHVFELILLCRIVLSWLHKDNAHEITRFICKVVDPVLTPLRRIIPSGNTGIDFSPVVLFILIDLVKRALFNSYF